MKCDKANEVDLQNAARYFSFEQQNNHQLNNSNQEIRSPFHLHEISLIDIKNAAETTIQIIAANKPVANPALCRYLHEKRISKDIADVYCFEVIFKIENNDELFTAIGFKNNAGGYELRKEFLCLNSFPKYISYIVNSKSKTDAKKPPIDVISEYEIVSQNGAENTDRSNTNSDANYVQRQAFKSRKSIAVFEDFFDFLSFQTIYQNEKQPLPIFLVVNTLDLFERSLLLMEKHKQIHLYLKHDNGSRKCIQFALKRSSRYKDESILYKDYESLHTWLLHFGSLPGTEDLKEAEGIRLP
jgi:hypothetical protein